MISFDPTLFATPQIIRLTGTLKLSGVQGAGPIVIDGVGPDNVTIDGGKTIGDVIVDSNVTATLSDLVIANGSVGDGGGIYNDGTLTVVGCSISNNTGTTEGGGIDNDGARSRSPRARSPAIQRVLAGGGIENSGKLTITDSFIGGNSSDGDGGGIGSFGNFDLDISNSTIDGNSAASGGGIVNSDPMTAVNTTIDRNEGGIAGSGGGLDILDGPDTLINSIVALNALDIATASDIAGTVSSASAFNLIGTGGSGGLTDGKNGNQVGIVDPGLGSFGFHGGPTPTIPLLTDSPAVGTGSISLAVDPSTSQPLTTDQRGAGFVRQFDGVVNIGAYELQPHLGVTSEPPGSVASDSPFPITVAIFMQSGLVDTGFDGKVTLVLVNSGGATLGGTLTVAAHEGVATFTGLTINRPGTYRIMASTDPAITALTTPMAVTAPPTSVAVRPNIVAIPPTIVAESILFAGKGHRRHAVGFELEFGAAMDPARAGAYGRLRADPDPTARPEGRRAAGGLQGGI